MIHAPQKKYEDILMPLILPQVLNVPEFAILNYIKDVAVDFCKETFVWQGLQNVLVAQGVQEILFDIPKNALVHRVLSLKGIDVFQTTTEGVIIERPFGQNVESLADIVLVPSVSSDSMPQCILEAYGRDMAYGVLFKLKSMAGSGIEWSDPQGAEFNYSLYNEGIAKAKIDIAKTRRLNRR